MYVSTTKFDVILALHTKYLSRQPWLLYHSIINSLLNSKKQELIVLTLKHAEFNLEMKRLINPLQPSVTYLYPLQTSENF